MNGQNLQADDMRDGSGREPMFNLPTIIIVLIAICVIVQLVQSYLLTPAQEVTMLVRGAFIPARYSGQYILDLYAFTTLVSYSFMHGGFTHLVVNMVWLAAIGTPLANRIGALRFVLFWVVCAVCAAGLHYLLHSGDNVPLVGASGAIAGMMAATPRYLFRVARFSGTPAYVGPLPSMFAALRSTQVLVFVLIWMGGNLLVGVLGAPGVADSIAWEAHVGGFLAGFILIGLFDRSPTPWPRQA